MNVIVGLSVCSSSFLGREKCTQKQRSFYSKSQSVIADLIAAILFLLCDVNLTMGQKVFS